MNRKLIAVGLTGLLLAPACGSGGSPVSSTAGPQGRPAPAGVHIDISDFAYSPQEVEVDAGEAIVWTNQDDIAHTVTSGKPKKQGVPGVSPNRDAQPDGVFDSASMELDDTFTFTPGKSGTFTYFCAIHAGMSARIIVR